jgi:hypothetical protein
LSSFLKKTNKNQLKKLFHDVAYKAVNRFEIIKAFDDFLDQVTVLPPGEWDPNIRLEPPVKVPLKEERLERIENIKLHIANGKDNDHIKAHDVGDGLEFTGRYY